MGVEKATIVDAAEVVPVSIRGYRVNMAAFSVRYKQRNLEVILLIHGKLKNKFTEPVLVCVHSACMTSEVFLMENCDCARQLRKSIGMICKRKKGILVYLP